MSSEVETTDLTCPTANASNISKIENAPAVTETTVIVNLLETTPAAPSITSPIEVDSASTGSVGNQTSVSSKYPKLNASCPPFLSKILTNIFFSSSATSSSV